jgi:hypothetical protein
MIHMNQGLGFQQVKQMEAEGWMFSDSAIRVGNGWLMWCKDPNGNLKLQLLADPTDEPEKFPQPTSQGTQSVGCVDAQLALGLAL